MRVGGQEEETRREEREVETIFSEVKSDQASDSLSRNLTKMRSPYFTKILPT